ncbi:MAG: UDP-N-acetylglucosamine 1-carboxyvinyltransferase [Chloroflexi bacterium]|nr:UDP-N-acetylglucosamine 1-carboxyvinyltransferase [Chloroflexota bacterium]
MEKFIIDGGVPLRGVVTPSGNKNAALPLLAACLLTDEPVVLHNLPEIKDVQAMRSLLESLGAEVENLGGHSWRIHAKNVISANLDSKMCSRIRASILLAGPISARTGWLVLPPPGGDVIGRRRVDTHILALSALGVQAEYNCDERVFEFAASGLTGGEILLDEASVTATENAIMAAVTARGETVIRNAASEPHVQELCHFLNTLGGKIKHVGSNMLHITGVSKLHGGEFTIGPDYLEVVSFIGAAVVTGGEIRIRNAGPNYLSMVRLVFRRIGVNWLVDGDDIIVPGQQNLVIQSDIRGAIPEISVMPWPAFPSDLMSIAIVVATQAKGSVLLHDWMYEGRMYFTDKLSGMGAQIVLCDPHRCIVQGPTDLMGEEVDSPDIRAGLALVLAALAADGESVIRNVGQIDRGYERIEEKLRGLGARIERKT